MDDAYWKMYTIVIQFGAIMALMLLFLERIIGFTRSFPEGEDGRHTIDESSHHNYAGGVCLHFGSGAAAA